MMHTGVCVCACVRGWVDRKWGVEAKAKGRMHRVQPCFRMSSEGNKRLSLALSGIVSALSYPEAGGVRKSLTSASPDPLVPAY